jgi:hypothetical protein
VEATDLTVNPGLDLLDSDDTYVMDISSDLLGGTVEHGNYQTIHGTCTLQLSRRLEWGSARVRPWVTYSSAILGLTQTWNLGTYLLSTPERRIADVPEVYNVQGYDKLVVLDTPAGRSIAVDAGTSYLTAAEALIVEAGEPATSIRLDELARAKVLPSTRVWPFEEGTSYLRVINDLVQAVGYRGVYVDRDGYFRSESYVAPRDQAPEWVYDADSVNTIVGADRTETLDYFSAPNRWVFVNDDPLGGEPTVGDGQYVVVNQSDGVTSVDARGRIITRGPILLEAADQESLERQGNSMVDTDKRLATQLALPTGPNPTHWHFSVVEYRDSALGVPRKMVQQSWSLPLTGEDMTHALREV